MVLEQMAKGDALRDEALLSTALSGLRKARMAWFGEVDGSATNDAIRRNGGSDVGQPSEKLLDAWKTFSLSEKLRTKIDAKFLS
jgi:hypothetical protein